MKPGKISPLAPDEVIQVPVVEGVRIAATAAGIKYAGRNDLMIMSFDPGTTVAGVFTKSKCPSAPVDHCKTHLPEGKARLLIVNSGNANAFTGSKGSEAVNETVKAGIAAVDCNAHEIFAASTGVIGEPLDAAKIAGRLPELTENANADGWRTAADAIMTTDTYPKLATAKAMIGDVEVTINGIAKGAGMIQPDMATMLSFVATDAAIEASALQTLLNETVGPTFNSITVDSDTSTSDTLMLFATGAAENRGALAVSDPDSPVLSGFRAALEDVLKDLALQVVCDGEGATKLMEITIEGAESDLSAKSIALAVGNSPLVKTAICGEDANWGRVVMAIGKAGEPADRDRLSIWFGEHRLAHNGERDPAYDEEVASAYMKNDRIKIRANVGVGKGTATVWSCDLTKDYVAINGDYRS